MPLHLLPKKSWNVYSSANIERVRKDEVEAAAREEEADRRMQEYDAARRIAILRGEQLPPLPEPLADEPRTSHREDKSDRPRDDRRKRRRLAGEDDTDRDIRLAREEAESTAKSIDGTVEQRKVKSSDAPITDHAGHINLFPIEQKGRNKTSRNAEAEAEKKRKERELEDQYTMRFVNAAGKEGLERKPWYTDAGLETQPKNEEVVPSNFSTTDVVRIHAPTIESKNVWGRPDPHRKQREEARVNTGDPLAGMRRAQGQLKAATRDRTSWNLEREREVRALEKARRREEKEERRRHRKDTIRSADDDVGGLEGFSLDANPNDRKDHSGRDDKRSRNHDRVRERGKDRAQDRSRRRHSRDRLHTKDGQRIDHGRDPSHESRHHRRARSRPE